MLADGVVDPLSAKPGDPDRFSPLPAETRNAIYELALLYDGSISIRERRWEYGYAREAPLLQVSKQIREEAMLGFYGINSFGVALSTKPTDIDWTIHKLQSIIDVCGTRPFKKLRFFANMPKCDSSLLPLLEFIRSTGLKLYSDGDHAKAAEHLTILKEESKRMRGPSILSPALTRSHMLQDELEAALEMAMRASEDGLGQAEMEERFVGGEW